MKVLDSVHVLEIGGLGPGPFCAMHLADLDIGGFQRTRSALVLSKKMARTGMCGPKVIDVPKTSIGDFLLLDDA